MRIGLDIGYSGLKFVYSPKGEPRHAAVLPVGAAPAESMGANFMGSGDEGIRVLVDGVPYIAGVEPSMIPGNTRSLDRKYTESPQYRALLNAALRQAGSPQVACLATGLPVNLFFNAELRKDLKARLTAKHQVAPGRDVAVRDVRIYPQPAGMYMAWMDSTHGAEEAMADKAVLVIDPGFFSVDSVVIRNNRPYPGAAATSTEAMSRVLELADKDITQEFGDKTAMLGLYKGPIEQKLRQGKTEIFVAGTSVDTLPWLKRAGDTIAQRALPTIESSLRGLGFDIDVVLVAGGGARFYAPTIKERFPRQQVIVMANAPLANAHGFRSFAERIHVEE